MSRAIYWYVFETPLGWFTIGLLAISAAYYIAARNGTLERGDMWEGESSIAWWGAIIAGILLGPVTLAIMIPFHAIRLGEYHLGQHAKLLRDAKQAQRDAERREREAVKILKANGLDFDP